MHSSANVDRLGSGIEELYLSETGRVAGGNGLDNLISGREFIPDNHETANIVKGRGGDDRLFGGGNDSLLGGDDRLSGGSGADEFLFAAGRDVITDLGAGDVLIMNDGLRGGGLCSTSAKATC